MRKVSFEVPTEVIGEFTEKMLELGLNNSITGKTEGDELEIEVQYDKEESEQVDELEEYLDELIEQIEEEEEEEDEDK